MAALIQSLFGVQPDTMELVREKIGEILLVELARQRQIAAATYMPVTASAGGSNVGDGTCTAVSIPGTPDVGNWTLRCTTAVATGGVFELLDEDGAVSESGLTITPGVGSMNFVDIDGLSFTLNVGATDFEVGDTFSLPLAFYDPNNWKLRVFSGRSAPWAEFLEPSEDRNHSDYPYPIVNISFDRETFDKSRSTAIARRKADATFNIDCYGYGVGRNLADGGHDQGDARAEYESHRAVRLVRNVLDSAHYHQLAMPDLVWERWLDSITTFQPPIDQRSAQHVIGTRVALQVAFNEFSPQFEGELLELISVQVLRSGTGQLLLRADYPL